MEILGHRGWPAPAHPENTLGAVRAALAAGAHGVEVDIRMTADGAAVCCHDPDLVRTSGVPHLVRRTSCAALRKVRLAGGHRMPLLEEVVALVAGRGLLVLDLKPEQRRPALVRAVLDAMDGLPAADVVLSSTERPLLRAFATAWPHSQRALITGAGVPVQEAVDDAVAHGDAAVHPSVRELLRDPRVMVQAKSAGLAVRAWTVNRVLDARMLELAEVDAVITDVPATLLRDLRGAAAAAAGDSPLTTIG